LDRLASIKNACLIALFLGFLGVQGCQRKREGELWLDFSEGQNDDGSKPTQKKNIHEKSFHSYIYRQIGPLG
jgi:hypothetical protein